MNGIGGSAQVAVATVTVPMMSDSDPSTSKRKADDSNVLNLATKKRKKEPSAVAGTSRTKLTGEKKPGGLIITRVPFARADSAQASTSLEASQQSLPHPPSVPLSSQTLINGDHVKPISNKPVSEPEPPLWRPGKGKGRDISCGTPEVEEDVRRMQSETEHLRARSRPPDGSSGKASSEYRLPPQALPKTPKASRDRIQEMSQPIATQETPQIARNKIMRADPGSARRKSSINRGKRISSSFENTGVIAQPHTSVRASSFYKHIDADLPEPQRAQQLLIWCSHRAINQLAEENAKAASSKRNAKNSGKDPPPLSPEDAELLKSVEEEVIRMLADKQIDTSVYSRPGVAQTRQLKVNEQNVRNKVREIKFNARIQRLKQEDEAWNAVANSYNAYRQNVLAGVKKRKEDITSGRVKGKQRATAEEIALWDINERDLPAHFMGNDGLQLARSIVAEDPGKQDPLRDRLQDLAFTVDQLRLLHDSALLATRTAENDLNRRFAQLNLVIGSRIHSSPPPVSSGTVALSSYLPATIFRPSPASDPQDLLRALSRMDAERPQTQVGDAVRRAAREVQRAHDASNGLIERRLTDVPPPTPRKPPGTPRRATTPARGR